jgi:hypothetical protein
MHQELCYCSKRLLDVNKATYAVELYGVVRPMCFTSCYATYRERAALKDELQRREWAARSVEVGSWNGA